MKFFKKEINTQQQLTKNIVHLADGAKNESSSNKYT